MSDVKVKEKPKAFIKKGYEGGLVDTSYVDHVFYKEYRKTHANAEKKTVIPRMSDVMLNNMDKLNSTATEEEDDIEELEAEE